MPRVVENIEPELLPVRRQTLGVCTRADFCVGYSHLRGREAINALPEKWAHSADQQPGPLENAR